MQVILLYVVTAVVFLGLDVPGIKFLVRPAFERSVGHLLADPMRVGPAAVFYLGFTAGLLYFVSIPALRAGAPLQALVGGALLGLLAYGTYELTNYATLADWSLQQVIVDCAWGTVLCGVAAWAGVAVMSGRLG